MGERGIGWNEDVRRGEWRGCEAEGEWEWERWGREGWKVRGGRVGIGEVGEGGRAEGRMKTCES